MVGRVGRTVSSIRPLGLNLTMATLLPSILMPHFIVVDLVLEVRTSEAGVVIGAPGATIAH